MILPEQATRESKCRKNGIEARIAFNTDGIDPNESYVIDSESRNIPAEEAYEKVKKIYQDMETYHYDHYYQKNRFYDPWKY